MLNRNELVEALESTFDEVVKVVSQRDELLAVLKELLPAYRNAVKLYDANHDDAFTVRAHNAIAKAEAS